MSTISTSRMAVRTIHHQRYSSPPIRWLDPRACRLRRNQCRLNYWTNDRARTPSSQQKNHEVTEDRPVPRVAPLFGWGGRIRTCECRDQNPVPYHLATPHHRVVPVRDGEYSGFAPCGVSTQSYLVYRNVKKKRSNRGSQTDPFKVLKARSSVQQVS